RKISQTPRTGLEMFRSPCPPPQPGSGSWCLLRSDTQFFCEAIQIGSHVDVVERVHQTYRKLPVSSARHQSFEGTRRAQSIVFEKSGMAGFCPHEIVAAILGRSHDQVKTIEHGKSSFQRRGREMRAVAVEGNDPLTVGFCKMRKH